MAAGLSGFGIELAPLEPAHASILRPVADAETFRHFPFAPSADTDEAWAEFIAERLARGEEHWLVLRSGEPVGSTAFLASEPDRQSIEIGATWYAASARGTRVNPACKRLLLAEAFESRGMMRVVLKCDARNRRSRSAIQRLGAVPEGVHRSVMPLADGTRRNTAWFSILAEEWPEVRRRLDLRLMG